MELRAKLLPHIEPLQAHIFVADQARAIYEVIGKYRSEALRANLGVCLGAVQASLADTYLLSLTKLYESDNPRYTINSVPTALTYLESLNGELPILEGPNVARFMALSDKMLGVQMFSAAPMQPAEILSRLRRHLPSLERVHECELSQTLGAFRTHRDKRVAHPERVDYASLPRASWEAADRLLMYAKVFLGIVGWAFMATIYVDGDGEYMLSRDAQMSGSCMERLLKMARLDGQSEESA